MLSTIFTIAAVHLDRAYVTWAGLLYRYANCRRPLEKRSALLRFGNHVRRRLLGRLISLRFTVAV